MLIRSYGRYWDPDLVNWGEAGKGNKGSLPGWAAFKDRWVDVDIWDQIGIYALHKNYHTVYVGRTTKRPLGSRLKSHYCTDHLAGRWDSFSWFGVKIVNKSGKLRESGIRQIGSNATIKTLEALSIYLVDPPLNRRQETIPEAVSVEQSPIEDDDSVEDKLDRILDLLESESISE